MKYRKFILISCILLHYSLMSSQVLPSDTSKTIAFLDSLEKVNQYGISISYQDSIKFASISDYLIQQDSIQAEHLDFLTSLILDEESSLQTVLLASQLVIDMRSKEGLLLLIRNIGLQRSNPSMIRPHELYHFPCYMALHTLDDKTEIQQLILSEGLLNLFNIEPLVLGNTAYLLSKFLDRTANCEIAVLEKSSLLDDNGRNVLNELRYWLGK